MNKEYEIDELLNDESFIDWVRRGKPSENSWYSIYLENESLRQCLPELEQLIHSIIIRDERITPERKQRIKESINRSIDQKPVYVYVPEYSKYSTWRNVAAAVLILFVLYIGYHKINIEQSTDMSEVVPQYIVRTTGAKERPTIKLSDGSKVTLNANSQIRYLPTFSDSARIIELEGEAFFEVSQNIYKPFIVISKGVTTKALGTSFNINSRANGASVNVILATGKVEITHSDIKEGSKVLLLPAQQVEFNIDKGEFSEVMSADLTTMLAWKDNIIHFDKASRDEVFTYLSDWYGIRIIQNDSKATRWKYSGKFQNESLHNVLTSIGYVKGFDFEMKTDSVIIYDN